MTIDDQKAIAKRVIASAWTDDVYKKKLIEHPNRTFEEAGLPVSHEFRVSETEIGAGIFHLPKRPADFANLSSIEVEERAGMAIQTEAEMF